MVGKSTECASLARRLLAMKDSGMRVTYLRHALRQMDGSELADLLVLVKTKVEVGDPVYSQFLLTVSLALADESCDEMRRVAAIRLESCGQNELARTLKRVDAEVDAGTGRVPDFGVGRPLTLGERKALARRNDRGLIVRVVRDPHPSVIRILLDNPGLTELDVVHLCARRPTVPDIQREVFRNRRWIARYRVKMAIVLNPYTPLDVALQIAPHLKKQDRRRIAASEDLPGELRDSCARRDSKTRERGEGNGSKDDR